MSNGTCQIVHAPAISLPAQFFAQYNGLLLVLTHANHTCRRLSTTLMVIRIPDEARPHQDSAAPHRSHRHGGVGGMDSVRLEHPQVGIHGYIVVQSGMESTVQSVQHSCMFTRTTTRHVLTKFGWMPRILPSQRREPMTQSLTTLRPPWAVLLTQASRLGNQHSWTTKPAPPLLLLLVTVLITRTQATVSVFTHA